MAESSAQSQCVPSSSASSGIAESEKDQFEDSPPLQSLFLCPVQLSALLEAAPVSLITRGYEGKERFGTEGGEIEIESWEVNSEREVIGGSVYFPNKDERNEGSFFTNEINQTQSKPLSWSHSDSCLELAPAQADSTVDLGVDVTVSCEGQICESSMDHVMKTNDNTVTVQCNDSEDDEEENDHKPFPPLHMGYHSHSRNVSETPSLPPFHGSSTSSAYHSRNSSLGSQVSSSCFESDSVSQATDMDSCLTLHTAGRHSETHKKQSVKFQDSHLVMSDPSHMCYRSTLHSNTDPLSMIQSRHLRLHELSSSFEDTLRFKDPETLDERHTITYIKSSEWIKKQLDRNEETLVQVKLSSKTKHVVHFNVKAGDVIIWEFATKKRDVGFGLHFETTEVATAHTAHEGLEKKVMAILPVFRVGAHIHPTIGSHAALQDGVYEIVWDNTYSRFFAKDLYYRITTQPAEPNENYSQQ